MNLIARLIATFLGVGALPYFPGTMGSVAGILLAAALSFDPRIQAVVCAAAAVSGIWAAGVVSKQMKEEDPRVVVIDEVAGMMLSVLFLPVSWQLYLAAFLIFRFLDIFKPLLIRKAEDLPGGWGVMADDLLAGAVTHIILRFVLSR